MDLNAINTNNPIQKLHRDRARAMASLAIAMHSVECWHDTMIVAEAIMDVEFRFRPMLREAEMMMQESSGPSGQATGPINQVQQERRSR